MEPLRERALRVTARFRPQYVNQGQVQATPAVHYLLMHHVTPNLVASKGANQPRADLLRSLYSRLVSRVSEFAQDKIENYRHTHFAVKRGV
jgi:hypothetical protein